MSAAGTRLLLIGPPGAGKGTQASVLSTTFDVPAISTGDIFRHNVAHETPLGLQAKAFMDAGDNVPDSLTNDLITDRLEQADCAGGFLLDGYPPHDGSGAPFRCVSGWARCGDECRRAVGSGS